MSEPERQAWADAAAPMRLQRFLARAGLDSRRHAEAYITAGRVSVNGAVVTELGTKVLPDDDVRVDGAPMRLPEEETTLMLHKPRGVITAMEDPFDRPTVASLLPAIDGLFHVGRLDGDSSGLLLFTTDGALGNDLVHPRRHVPKRYIVGLRAMPDERALARLREGVELEGRRTLPAEVELVEPKRALKRFGASADDVNRRRTRAFIDITLHEGRTRQIREMVAAVGNEVVNLHRYGLGPLTLGALKVGQWRRLSAEEVEALRRAVEGPAQSC